MKRPGKFKINTTFPTLIKRIKGKENKQVGR
jgi:hypothetical protein